MDLIVYDDNTPDLWFFVFSLLCVYVVVIFLCN